MASAIKKVNKISQIVRLKHMVHHWKAKSLNRLTINSYIAEPAGSDRRTPPGSLAVYVGQERLRFVIPTRFLNLPIFLELLNQAEEEFGYQISGGLVLPCEVGFFRGVLMLLDKDERRYGGKSLDEFLKMVSELGFCSFDQSCKEMVASSYGFRFLQKVNV
ncbi:hypothetical protein Leryth_010404 [Lithospermum erythrorhizon]|nr:hypothetical protein Leryth_010404 [Lithospermum erythrorhizon]